eukprot:7465633-Alexandrium_andersonii.AAC.1
MSASLVGSEMCIRDRLLCARSRSPQSPITAAKPPPSHSLLRRPRRAVSYTHLTLPTICSV